MFKNSKYQLFICLILLIASCKKEITPDASQAETFVKLYGGSTIDSPRDIVLDGDNIAITGAMNTPNKGAQVFLIFADKNGNELPWSPVLMGNGLNDVGNCIFRTSDGGFVVVGTEAKSTTNTDLLVAKISATGEIAWSQFFGGEGKEEGHFGLELSSGGFIIGGYTESIGNGSKDIYIIRLDANGNFVWTSAIGAQNNEVGNDIVELNGSLYIVGSTDSYGFTGKKIYIVRVNIGTGKGENYNFFGTSVGYSTSKLYVMPENQLLLMGSGNNSTYLNSISADLYTSYWVKEFEENNTDLFFNNGKISLLGETNVNQNTDINFRELDAVGNEIRTKIITSEGNQFVNAAMPGSDGKIYITGSNSISGLSQIFLIKKEL